MSDIAGGFGPEAVLHALADADPEWTTLFARDDHDAQEWGRSAIERLALMASGEAVEFALGGLTPGRNRIVASAVLFTGSRSLELEETTFGTSSRWTPITVIARPRSDLLSVRLVDLQGESDAVLRVGLELRYRGRDEPLLVDSRGWDLGDEAPLTQHLPSLMRDLGRSGP